jgi:3-hydroxybutyryl-CoA dehydratase
MNSYRWKDLAVGMTAEFRAVVSQHMMDMFRELSGDTNPLHRDAEFARAAGHPQPVVFGMLTASLYSTLIGVHLPGRFGVLHGVDIDFHSPVYVGDELIIRGEVAFLSEAVRRVELKAIVRNGSGRRVSKATVRAGVHEH